MNTDGTTKCGYAGSDMVGILDKNTDDCQSKEAGTGTLRTIYDQYIKNDFMFEGTERVIQYSNFLTNKTDETRINRFGVTSNNANLMGASSGWGWYTRKLDLMSEMNVYGGIVASSSLYDTGIDNRQYAIFRLKPELINSYGGTRFTNHYWLKDVVSSTYFANVVSLGSPLATPGDASVSFGVRPRFLIG